MQVIQNLRLFDSSNVLDQRDVCPTRQYSLYKSLTSECHLQICMQHLPVKTLTEGVNDPFCCSLTSNHAKRVGIECKQTGHSLKSSTQTTNVPLHIEIRSLKSTKTQAILRFCTVRSAPLLSTNLPCYKLTLAYLVANPYLLHFNNLARPCS